MCPDEIEGKPKERVKEAVGSPLGLVLILMDLLIEEKRQAGLRPDDLYYVGMASTAKWWCGGKSILENRKQSWTFS